MLLTSKEDLLVENSPEKAGDGGTTPSLGYILYSLSSISIAVWAHGAESPVGGPTLPPPTRIHHRLLNPMRWLPGQQIAASSYPCPSRLPPRNCRLLTPL